MSVLVTGGCGFIGSHVADTLLAKGYDVSVLGLKCDLSNIRGTAPKVKFSRTDIQDKKAVLAAVDGDTEAVLHLAALINVDESIQTPEPFWNVNVLGTFNVLEAARQKHVGKLVFMSTCEVYGNIPSGRADEAHPTNPLSPYAASKFAAERYLLSYTNTFGSSRDSGDSHDSPNIYMFRGFNQYGPRQNSGSRGAVIARFATMLLDGRKVGINGTGEQTRDYVYVQDTASAIVSSLEKKIPNGEVINIASERDVTIRSAAEMLCGLTGRDFDTHVEFRPPRQGELMRSCGDASKAKRLLGWRPSITFEEGLARTVAWYRDNKGNYTTR